MNVSFSWGWRLLLSCSCLILALSVPGVGQRIAGGGGPISFTSTVPSYPVSGPPALQGGSGSASGGPGMFSPPFAFYPMAGVQGEDFSIGNYVDLDPSPGVMDFNCGPFSYNGHDASDAPIGGFEHQAIGVPIFAAADGFVTATHDGEFDMNTQWAGQPSNYVVINHGNNLVCNYYHMKKNSVAVSPGDFVKAGQMIGMVGSSGNSTAPHLHFSVYDNGQLVEPFAGPCNSGPSYWRSQPPLPNEAKVVGFGVSRTTLAGVSPPPGPMPRGGYKLLSDQDFFFWFQLEAMPAFTTGQNQFIRPNGSIAFDSGVFGYNNPSAYGGSWWWGGYNIPEMNSVPGVWKIRIRLNGKIVADAPIRVLPTTPVNLSPSAVSVVFSPAAPMVDEPLQCRVTSDHIVADPDYDIVRHRWQWKVNGSVVRDITTAARTDVIPGNLFVAGDLVSCDVTPSDGTLAGPSTLISAQATDGSPYPGSGEDFELTTGINAGPSSTPAIKSATAGDLLTVHIESPMGSYDFLPAYLYGQTFVTGFPPAQPILYPEVHIDFEPTAPTPAILLYSPYMNLFAPTVLPMGGMTFTYSVPAQMAGVSFLMQAYSLAGSANTGTSWFTATDAHEVQIM